MRLLWSITGCWPASLFNGNKNLFKGNDMENKHYVYILLCADGTLYTGYTNDLEKRIAQHNEGKEGAKYTRSRRPCKLVYHEEYDSKTEALKREYFIKHKMMRDEKQKLIDSYKV